MVLYNAVCPFSMYKLGHTVAGNFNFNFLMYIDEIGCGVVERGNCSVCLVPLQMLFLFLFT